MKKGTLAKYSKRSALMDIAISYGEESFKFNLFQELVVDENTINREIQEQPSAYAFLGMLHKKLNRIMQDKKKEMEKTYAIMFIKYKKSIDENTGRPTANDLAKEQAVASKRYQDSIDEYHQAQEEHGIIETCVKSFEQRATLIQTLSANIRKTS